MSSPAKLFYQGKLVVYLSVEGFDQPWVTGTWEEVGCSEFLKALSLLRSIDNAESREDWSEAYFWELFRQEHLELLLPNGQKAEEFILQLADDYTFSYRWQTEPFEDEPDWDKLVLTCADPSANIPVLIDQVAAGNNDASFDLWTAICHQGTVYPVSYAALPLLTRKAVTSPSLDARFKFLSLAACIVGSQDGPLAYKEVKEQYDRFIGALELSALQCMRDFSEPDKLIWCTRFLLALRGEVSAGEKIESFLVGE